MDEIAEAHKDKDTMVDQAVRLSYSDAAGMVRAYLVPRYVEPTNDMPGGYYWCEDLDTDAPPQKVARCNRGIDSEGNEIGGVWRRWTIAGWVDLTGRVCPIGERPE